MNWTVVLAIVLGLAAAFKTMAGDRRADDRRVDLQRAEAVAEATLTAHRAAELWVSANPGASGAVPLSGTQGRRIDGISACVTASRVATWVAERSGAPAGAVADAMRARLGGWPAAGIALTGRVLAGMEDRGVLPCDVPDGAPVVVTTVPG